MRTENSNSLALERSMNLQCKIMTFEEALRNAQVVDKLDDERREKMFGLIKWQNDMFICFKKQLDSLLMNYTKNSLELFICDFVKFNTKFNESFEKIKNDELYYENLDDELRDYLIKYAIRCREDLRIENSQVEEKLIRENKERKNCK